MAVRDGQAAGQPIGQIGVLVVQHRLQLIQLRLGKACDMAADKAAHHQVSLLGATVMRPEDHPAAARG